MANSRFHFTPSVDGTDRTGVNMNVRLSMKDIAVYLLCETDAFHYYSDTGEMIEFLRDKYDSKQKIMNAVRQTILYYGTEVPHTRIMDQGADDMMVECVKFYLNEVWEGDN